MPAGEAAFTKFAFTKMEGAGNDYVYLDGFTSLPPLDQIPAIARAISDRHFGVGSDGLIVLAPSKLAACRMLMWNADGSRGAMCGNGLRCLAKLAHDLGHVQGLAFAIETDVGQRRVELHERDGKVVGARVEMAGVTIDEVARSVTIAGRDWSYYAGDAGNPHAVIFVDEPLEGVPVTSVGAAFQRLTEFGSGVNVEFVGLRSRGHLEQRTFERGSGETLACGSGATVAALAAVTTGRVPGPTVEVHLRGGVLAITVGETALVMEGPARTVFRGEFDAAVEPRSS